MSIAKQWDLVSIEDYLARELDSPTKHEYLGGIVYAMSGGRIRHNLIATNAAGALWARLRNKPCHAFNSDMKIRIRLPGHTRFYYPDASVVCQMNPQDELFQDAPVLLVEVLSDSTRRLDLGEKREAYFSIASLELYLTIEPSTPTVVGFRRTESGFVREVWHGLDAVIAIPELDLELPLSELYEGVDLSTPADD